MTNNINAEALSEYLQKYVPEAKLERISTTEASYVLPIKSVDSFPNLFKGLENDTIEGCNVKDFGVSMTSLEEVFLNLADDVEADVTASNSNNKYETFCNESQFDEYECSPSFCQSYISFLKLRLAIFFQNKSNFFTVIIMPLVIFILSYFLMSTSVPDNHNSALKLSLSTYSDLEPLFRYTSNMGEMRKQYQLS